MTQPMPQKPRQSCDYGAIRSCGGNESPEHVPGLTTEVAQGSGFREPPENSHITDLSGTGGSLTQPVPQPVTGTLLVGESPRERPILLDLFCGAGGAAMGYHRAGFDVIGVDIKPQPRYPFRFEQADAPNYLLEEIELQTVERCLGLKARKVDVVHASPPCQRCSPLSALARHKRYPDFIAVVRRLLDRLGAPYVIENVMTAPLDTSRSVVLCGGMFGLRTYRHRRFESLIPLVAPSHPRHVVRTATRQRRQRWAEGWHVSVTGDVGTYVGPEALGIDWMNGAELCEAIPPAYTEYIGRQLLAHLNQRAVA